MAAAQKKLPSEFQLRVYKLCFSIPRGKVRAFFPRIFFPPKPAELKGRIFWAQVATYGSIAKQLGVAPRAVGQAMRVTQQRMDVLLLWL